MKQLTSYMVLNMSGVNRVSYTFDEIDDETGEVVSTNNKGSFVAVNPKLKGFLTQTQNWLTDNKLSEE